MQTLMAFTALVVLCAPVLADVSQADGKGLYPHWLISHEG